MVITKKENEYLTMLFNHRIYWIKEEKKKHTANNDPKADQENENYKKATRLVLDKELKVLQKVKNKNWKSITIINS